MPPVFAPMSMFPVHKARAPPALVHASRLVAPSSYHHHKSFIPSSSSTTTAAAVASTTTIRCARPPDSDANANANSESKSNSEDPPEWRSFRVADGYLRLSQTLVSGQVFRWRRTGEWPHALAQSGMAEEWVGTIGPHAYVLRQTVPSPQQQRQQQQQQRQQKGQQKGSENRKEKNDGDVDPIVWYRVLGSAPGWSTKARAIASASSSVAAGHETKDDDDDNEYEIGTTISTAAATADAEADADAVLHDYFRVDTDFSQLYDRFCEADAVFARTFPYFSGMRTLRQPPEECLFAFICSSNNNIKRISSMVDDLAKRYGTYIVDFHTPSYSPSQAPSNNRKGRKANENDDDDDNKSSRSNRYALYAFPSTEELAEQADEKDLRTFGFGYRAKFITAAAKGLVITSRRHAVATSALAEVETEANDNDSHPEQQQDDPNKRAFYSTSTSVAAGSATIAKPITVEEMLLSWRHESRVAVVRHLSAYTGIGRKVAACIALMSLDQLGEIPVDTHVWQIAQRYRPELAKTKSLTLRVHEDVGKWFRDRFGDDVAGIAHNVLFVAELGDFKKTLPDGTDLWQLPGSKKEEEVNADDGSGITNKRKRGRPSIDDSEKKEKKNKVQKKQKQKSGSVKVKRSLSSKTSATKAKTTTKSPARRKSVAESNGGDSDSDKTEKKR